MKLFTTINLVLLVALFLGACSTSKKIKQDGYWENMVEVQGGSYMMGCAVEDKGCSESEKPQLQVKLSTFYISKYEVTQQQWFDIMGTRPSYQENCNNCPVEQISHDSIQIFLKKLNAKTGKNYRLPTEAEWEFAARGGNKSKGYKYSGSNNINDVAWYKKTSKEEEEKKTFPVGSKRANELGLYDMTGNVWEWCSDWYAFFERSNSYNPKGAASSYLGRVKRGCSCYNKKEYCNVTNRYALWPSYRSYTIGFRLAHDDVSADYLASAEKDKRKQAEKKELEQQKFKHDNYWKNMVEVQGGNYMMGCTSGDSECDDDEKPQHQVELSTFYISKYEVTQQQWFEIMAYQPSHNENCNDCPVDQVSYKDIQVFLNTLNHMTGKNYRLPTEAEWEYAARGGNKSRGYKYSGSNNVSDVAWYYKNSKAVDKSTSTIGKKRANELGLYDMTGNVSEWCIDRYTSYDKLSSNFNPQGAKSGSSAVYRGGSWLNKTKHCRLSIRFNSHPNYSRDKDLGFRLAHSL